MNDSRQSVARGNRAARRNYFILCLVATLLLTTSVLAAFLMSN